MHLTTDLDENNDTVTIEKWSDAIHFSMDACTTTSNICACKLSEISV
jgi:hypothetical protein